MATVVRIVRPGVTRRLHVKNLGWFFAKARTTVIEKFDLWQSNQGWEMFVNFADGDVFETPYASLEVFKDTMGRQRSLKGVEVTIHRADGSHEKWAIGKARRR